MSELETRQSAAAPVDLEPVEAETAELAEFNELDDEDADLLAIPPRADDLGSALAARPPRLKLPKVTTALVVSALICAGFIGGALVQKHWGSSSSGGGAAAAFAAGRAGRGGGGAGGFGGAGGAGGAGGGTGSSVTGTVTVVSGNTLYVTASDGTVYTVKTSGSTAVNVTLSGTLSQVKPGQSVVIAGSSDSSGNVTATSITANSTAALPSPSASSTNGK
jgi:hypothetical protein